MEFERALGRHKHVYAEQIGRQHVVGELHALVAQAEYRRQRAGQRGFSHPGHVFKQDVAVGKNAGDELFEYRRFAENHAVELFENRLENRVHPKLRNKGENSFQAA